jgi:hypothetical protein
MAIKVGTDNKRNVIIAGALFCIVAYLGISQLIGGPSTPAPVPARAVTPEPATVRQAPANAGIRTAVGKTPGPAAKKLPNAGLDPALHMEKLALSESIEYAGSGRNIFSGEAAPVRIETALGPARPTGPAVTQIASGPPPPPQPPAIDLRYFGYSATKDGKRQAFLLHGDDIFEAAAGEIVNHRYKVVVVDVHSVQVTDLSYNNTQTLQITN